MTHENTANDGHGDVTRHSPDPRRIRRDRDRVALPGIEAILGQIVQLNGAVTLGIVSTKEAAILQKNLKILLDAQMKRANREETGTSKEALVDLCRRDPRALNAVEQFLTDSQVEWLLDEIRDDPDGSA